MADKNTEITKADKKAWQELKLKQLDVPSATQNAGGRLQPGEAFNFYRNS